MYCIIQCFSLYNTNTINYGENHSRMNSLSYYKVVSGCSLNLESNKENSKTITLEKNKVRFTFITYTYKHLQNRLLNINKYEITEQRMIVESSG